MWSLILEKAFAMMRQLHEDEELLTFRIYRGKTCIDEFTGTRGAWFDRVTADIELGSDRERQGVVH
jgi:hypothetical protein